MITLISSKKLGGYEIMRNTVGESVSFIEKSDHSISIYNIGDKFSMNTFDVYMIITLVYQYIIPLVYLIFAYTRMALKLWRNKIPGKQLRFVLFIDSKRF